MRLTRTFNRCFYLIKQPKPKYYIMKKTILLLAITSFFVGTMVTSCNSTTSKVGEAEKKVETAEENLNEANLNLNQAKLDSIIQWKRVTVLKIDTNDKNILVLKSKISSQKEDNKSKYEKKIAQLEKKNVDLKKKLDEFNEEKQTDWEAFKAEFNHDMDELNEAFKDLTIQNLK